jgi:hypothetical protein
LEATWLFLPILIPIKNIGTTSKEKF